ncbi:MAG: hypothetical protein GX862_08300 [Leucobacter sp.]|nr:hypothetical protein [Leucobacter sp.]
MKKNVYEWPWLRFAVAPEDGGGSDPVDDTALDPTDASVGDGDDPVDDPADAPLGEAGERALEAMKKKERETRAKLREAKAEIAALTAPKDGEQTPDQMRQEIERTVRAELNREIVAARVEAAAASLLADPSDATAFIDLSELDVDENGKVDPSDIEDALKDLLAKKPHLAKQDATQGGSKKRVPEVPADPAGGTHEPLSLDERIAAAQKAGDFKTVIALQNERLEVAS